MKSILALIVLIAISFYGFSFTGDKEPEGKKVFVDSKCGSCHSVESAGLTTKSKKGTDLSEVGKKYDKEFLTKYISKKEKINNKNHAASFKGSEEELAKLTEWLSTLKGTK
jgi:cytochrome c553